MNSLLVSSGQSLLDICLQELGDVSAVFDLADANGLAITDALTPGQQLTIPESLLGRAAVVAYFATRGQRINTANLNQSGVGGPDPEVPTGVFDSSFDFTFN